MRPELLSVRFQDFRAFHDTGLVEIRPITFLVGENSAGKTSFLAGVRFLLEALSRGATNPFNRTPYFLGGFQQIAHYRGGPRGRAKSFQLSIRLPEGSARRHQLIRFRTNRISHVPVSNFTFSFTKGEPQPDLNTFTLQAGGHTVVCSLADNEPKLTITRSDRSRQSVSIGKTSGPPSRAIKENLSYLVYSLDDIAYSRSEMVKEVEPELDALGFDQPARNQLVETLRSSYAFLGQEVFASAPVRTQPSRTYTPSELTASAEGSHVPLMLSRAKLRTPAQWQIIKEGLNAFGRRSGLFTDIDVKQFGKSDIDPFQLQVKTEGPFMNIVDVGYGVSQVLPILFQIQNPSGHSAFLLQQPEVHLHPKAQAELGSLLAQAVSKTHNSLFLVETHSDYIIDRARILISEGRIKPEDLSILYFRRTSHGVHVDQLFCDEEGQIVNPPPGYRRFFLDEHARLLGV